jgi:peptidoglycan/LPS O-acetylase OafA/YrhL
MFHHFSFVQPQWKTAGGFAWMGVDLFFVLSGFLITGILFDARGSQRFFTNFYARRLVRIFPLYYAFVLLRTVLLPAIISLHRTYPPITADAPWYWLFLSNFRFAAHPQAFNTNVLDVSWSLAVEEHFYLVWPMIVFLFDRRTLMKILAGVIAAALAIRVALFVRNPDGIATYVLTFCRMDSLATGAMIALAARSIGLATLAHRAKPAFFIALATVIVILSVHGPEWQHNGLIQTVGFSGLAALFGSFLILGATSPPTAPLGRFLASGPMTFFGRYSYALYFLHSPIRDIIQYHVYKPAGLWGMFPFVALCLTLSILAALASWHLYEKHFLKLKKYFPAGGNRREEIASALVEPTQAPPPISAVAVAE